MCEIYHGKWKIRWLSHFYAKITGYFWLACPICGYYFGGHECTGDYLMTGLHTGKAVCSDCIVEVQRRNQLYRTTHPIP